MSVFIDCGAHKGIATKHWLKHHPHDTAIAFEPNPDIGIEPDLRMEVFRKAIGTANGFTSLYFAKNGRLESSSIVNDKRGLGSQSVLVPTVSFSEILLRYGPGCIVKMDIEGAEYEVLESMISSEAFKMMKTLYIEWHWKKMVPKTRHAYKSRHKSLLKQLYAIGTFEIKNAYNKEHKIDTLK